MVISILSLVPELFESFCSTSIIKKAVEKGIIKFNIVNLLKEVEPKVRVDAKTVGPGPGMVIKPEVIEAGIKKSEEFFGKAFKIFFSPQGELLTQKKLHQFIKDHVNFNQHEAVIENEIIFQNRSTNHILLVCPRFEGVDARVEEFYADLVLSIGNFVLLGGDLPAQVFLEGFIRLIPGVLGNQDSLVSESFESPIFDYPEYCKPDQWAGLSFPEVLLSGNHEKIDQWRTKIALQNTVKKRFDVFRSHHEAKRFGIEAINEIPNHYAVIMHDKVKNKEGLVGTTSIKSLDLHDISRSAKTYGIKTLFVVQPLEDQQKIATEFFDFWTEGRGQKQHSTRTEAVENLEIFSSLEEVLEKIEKKEKKKPVLVTTSAKKFPGKEVLFYSDQKKAWGLNKPLLLVFGTGYGLADEIMEKSDFVLAPIEGMVEYNHLSVRAAASIIFDRWLGLNPENPN